MDQYGWKLELFENSIFSLGADIGTDVTVTVDSLFKL
jgi:hypothetical protein